MTFDVLSDMKPLIIAAIPGLTNDQVAAEFTVDQQNCIMVGHINGKDPLHMFGSQKAAIIRPFFEIRMRHASEAIMHQWWDYIKIALDGLTEYIVGTRRYLIIYQLGDIIDLGRDENDNHIHVLKFEAEVQNAY